jgi:hypothetical protein
VRDKMFAFGALERTQQDYEQTFPERQYQEVLLLQDFGAKPIQTILYPLRDTTYTMRGDYQLTPAHGFFARWAHQINSQANDLIVPLGGGASAGAGHPDLSVETTDTNNMWSFVGSESWIIGNDAVNTLAVQVNSMSTINGIGDSVDAPINPTEKNLFFPSINIGQPSATTQQYAQKKIQIKDDFALQRGRHALKMGGDFAYYPDLAIILDIGLRGSLRFFDDPSTIVGSERAWAASPNTCTAARLVPGSASACGPYRQGFRTPGAVQSIAQGTRSSGGPLSDSGYVDPRQFSAYVNDDWRFNDRLTLNLGVRYDLAINFLNEKEMASSRIYQALKAIGNPYGALPKTPKTNFSPRAGFAWDIAGDGRTVLRGGSGVYFDQPSQSYGFNIARQSKPTIAISNTYLNTSVGVGQLANYVYGVSPLPSGPPPTPTELPAGGNTSGQWWDPNLESPYSVQAHLGLARQLTATTALAIDFTHVRNYREFRFGGALEINPIEGAWNPNADPAMYGRRRLVPALQAAFGDPALLSSVTIGTTQSRSRFDELVLHLQQRASRAVFQASYTLANARGFGGCIGGGGGSSGGNCQSPQNQDQFLATDEWGPTATDERHRIVLNGVFELPWGVQASPIFQAASGRPYTLTAGTDVNRDGTNNDRYVDPATGRKVGLNSARGDATWNLDARVTKAFELGRAGRKLDVFAELYNITDRVNFGGYNGTATSVFFQQPTAYFAGYPPSRQLQLGGRFSF